MVRKERRLVVLLCVLEVCRQLARADCRTFQESLDLELEAEATLHRLSGRTGRGLAIEREVAHKVG